MLENVDGYGEALMSLFKRRSDNADEIHALRAEIKAMSARLAEADAVAARTNAKKTKPLTAVPVRGHDLASVIARIDLLAQRLDDTNARVTAVASELAAQIDEVGRDGVPIEQLREAQVQLANAQARYQIQFNQGLAELADRLRDRDLSENEAPDSEPGDD